MRTKRGGGTCNELELSRRKTVTWLENIACGELNASRQNSDKETRTT